ELVADAVTDRRDIQSAQRLHVAGSEPAQSAITETGLGLMLKKFVEIQAKIGESGFNVVANIVNVEQIAAQLRADEKFRRQVADDPSPGPAGASEGLDPVVHHAIANCVGNGHVPIVGRS